MNLKKDVKLHPFNRPICTSKEKEEKDEKVRKFLKIVEI